MKVNGDEVTMIRYGRVNGVPKNILYTIRRGDTIYFGISRCNTKHDTFRKANGKLIASERAALAVEEAGQSEVSDFVLHHSGLRGVCTKTKVIDMLKYFDNIDSVILNELNTK